MASIPANQLINAEIVLTGNVAAGGGGTKTFQNIFHYRRSTLVVDPSKSSLDTIFQSTIVVPLGALLNVAWTQTQNTVRFLNDATDPPATFPHAVAGGIATTRSQDYDAAVYQFKSGFRGKSGRGSKHFGPLSDADAVGDVLAGGALANWVAFKATLLTTLTDADGNVWIPSIVSKGAVPPLSQLRTNPTIVFANDIIGVVLNKTLGTMRRRKVKTVTA